MRAPSCSAARSRCSSPSASGIAWRARRAVLRASAHACRWARGSSSSGAARTAREIPIEVSLSPLATDAGMTVVRRDPRHHRAQAHRSRAPSSTPSASRARSRASRTPSRSSTSSDRLVLCNSVYRRLVGEPSPGPIVGARTPTLLDAWLERPRLHRTGDATQFRTPSA